MVRFMPAKPLTPEQQKDATRLKQSFRLWQVKRRERHEPSSQEEVAERLGFGQSALNQYLNGKIPLNGEVLAKFSELLGVDPSDISPAIAANEVERSQRWLPSGGDEQGRRTSDPAATLLALLLARSPVVIITPDYVGPDRRRVHKRVEAEKRGKQPA